MLNRIFPRQIDNAYRGWWLAAGLLALIALGKAIQGFESMFNTVDVARTADGVPLDSFPHAAAEIVVRLFAVAGMHLTVLPILTVIVLIRYRAMIPLMFVMFLYVQLSQRGLALLHPTTSAGGGYPVGYYVNLVILAVTAAGFVLSLLDRSHAPKGAD